jgi:hypothetical protein
MPLGTSDTNCLRFYGSTLNRETMNIYREVDTAGLVIASRTTSTSNSKVYPILRLVSTDNPSTLVAGVSAQTNDLFRIDWNDKPTGGFTSEIHRMCFDIGNTQHYKTGYPHTFGLATSADAFSISVNGSTATPSASCLYIISDTINKMLYNTNTRYTNASWGTAPITLNQGNIYIKASNALNGNSTAFDMPLLMVSSNASPVEVAIPISNGANTTRLYGDYNE